MSTPFDGGADRPDDPFGDGENGQWPGDDSKYDGQGHPDPGYGAGQAYGAGRPDEWPGFGTGPGYGAQPGYGTQPAYGNQPMYGTQPSYGGLQPYSPGYPIAPYPVSRKEPAVSLILSFFLPGLGTIVSGQTGKGLAIMGGYFLGVLLSIVLIGIPIMLGFWAWGMVDGYAGARRHNDRHGFA